MGRRYPNEYTDTANARIASVRMNQADSGSSLTVQAKSVTDGRLHVALLGKVRARHPAAANSRLPDTAQPNARTRAASGRFQVESPEIAPARNASNAAARIGPGSPINLAPLESSRPSPAWPDSDSSGRNGASCPALLQAPDSPGNRRPDCRPFD